MELPKINYDDFYKFVTSFAIIIFLFSAYQLQKQMTKLYEVGINDEQKTIITIAFWIYVIIIFFSIKFFLWAIRKWKENQNKIDKLNTEMLANAKLENKLKKAELEYKISQLAEKEPGIFDTTYDNFLHKEKMDKVKARIKKKN